MTFAIQEKEKCFSIYEKDKTPNSAHLLEGEQEQKIKAPSKK